LIEAASGLSEARPTARLFRAWSLLAAALAVVPVVRIWQLTQDTDTTVTTIAVFAGAAWQIGSLLERVRQRPSRATRWLALGLLALGIWQLAWIGTDDFWFLRVAIVLWGTLWVVLPWGVAGLVWGWRVIAAFVVWAEFCDAPWQWSRDAYQTGDQMGPWLARITAQISGWILWQAGAPVKVSGTLIQLGQHVVSVGIPCTALPLIKLLLLLLFLATLLLRLAWLVALRLAVITLIVSFLVSIARVMLLAYVVRDPALFHYWHDPDGGGGGWFTAIGMVILAFLIARQKLRQSPKTPSTAAGPLPIAPNALPVLLASVTALIIVQFGNAAPRLEAAAPAPPPDFKLVSDSRQPGDGAVSPLAEPDEPAWTRRIRYSALGNPGQLEVIIAFIPRTLTGDPRDHRSLDREIPLQGGWILPVGSRYAEGQWAQGAAWITTIPGDGRPISTAGAWEQYLRHSFAQPGRWLAWLAHRAPLRDKRSYWLGAFETDGSAAQRAASQKLFFDWIALLTRSA